MLASIYMASAIIYSTKPLYADVEIHKIKSLSVAEIFNTISKADADYIARHRVDLAYGAIVALNSTGGDVDAAMKIGRIVREDEPLVIVREGAKCFSSCTLIYIAAVKRENAGLIGLHRPYFAAAPQSRQSIERQVPTMLQTLRTYVQEMGVTGSFYQEMVNTEPSNVKLYVGDEIQKIVPENDPTYDEVETSYDARKYGVDTAEMRVRHGEGRKKCYAHELGPGTLLCLEAISWGLSESVTEARQREATKCKLSDEEENTLDKVKMKERRDHTLWLRRETCERNVMLGR